MENKTHWEHIYLTKESERVSWYQLHPRLSLQYIQNTGIAKSANIIDVGGGASTLVDHLLRISGVCSSMRNDVHAASPNVILNRATGGGK